MATFLLIKQINYIVAFIAIYIYNIYIYIYIYILLYLIAMGIQDRRLTTLILVIPTRPPDSAPREAPNLLFGSL